jgi:hypothetical protein
VRTTTYEKIITGVAARMGLDPSAAILSSTRASLTEYLNTRIAIAWEWDRWPELCRIEQRSPEISGEELSLSYEQAGQEPFGEIFGIYLDDPDKTLNPKEVGYSLRNDRILLDPDIEASDVWVHYRLRPYQYSATSWSAATTYAAGDIVRASDGHCYEAILAGSNVQPPNGANWKQLPVPSILADYLKLSIASDALREDGQLDKANNEEYRAEGHLIRESDKIGLQVGGMGGRWSARVG